jgi:bacteriorhodopsin
MSLTRAGNRYYSLTAVFALSAMAFAYGLYSSRKELLRTLCCMSAICCYTISMQYFAMATEFGWFAIEVEFARGHQSPTQPTRQIFWIRYLSWWVA